MEYKLTKLFVRTLSALSVYLMLTSNSFAQTTINNPYPKFKGILLEQIVYEETAPGSFDVSLVLRNENPAWLGVRTAEARYSNGSYKFLGERDDYVLLEPANTTEFYKSFTTVSGLSLIHI